MGDKFTQIDIYPIDLSKGIFYGFHTTDSWWGRIESKPRRADKIGDIPEGVIRLYSEESILGITSWEGITMTSIVGGRSSDSSNTCTIIEF